MIRSQLAAVQSAFDEHTMQIEVTHNDVKVYLKKGMGRRRIETGLGLEENLLAAAKAAREPQQG